MEITVRIAEESDLEWVRLRVLESSAYSIPYSRDVESRLVRLAAEEDFDRVLAERENMVFLIAENSEKERMGVLILNLNHTSDATGERQSLIEDLDVEPRFWGSPAVNRLVHRAAQVTAENGLTYMVGHVAVGNRRTLLKAQRLGFEIERYHMVMGCEPDGPVPLPGRSDNDKTHDSSRLARRKGRS